MAHILVVDDEVALRRVIAMMLTRRGYEVTAAENGARALKLAEQTTFDLVITDLVMPEKEGIETIMTLRKRAPELRIIAMSGGGQGASGTYLGLARQLGASATLAKPFAMDDLLGTVERVLNSPVEHSSTAEQ
ncbi:MAG TPA: response regulator [Gemmatimonadaceae bacterium]|nr:response regulator [Gemmatimonadaceae bacterium]